MSIQVVHTDENQFGAEWQQIDMDSFTVLKRTLELNINDNEEFIKNMDILTK
ncbi:MAG: hypothetical protein L3J52_07295 [Proteobacteria bacterium]|nr:hypothetical protein [Pseudomonadota bacterium]